MKLHHKDGIFFLESTIEERHIPKEAGFRWHGNPGMCWGKCAACAAGIGKHWWTDVAPNALLLIQHADPEAYALLDATRTEIDASRAADLSEEAFNVPAPEGLAYLPYQRAGITYALRRQRSIIGDEMGLGKQQNVDSKVLTPKGWVRIGDVRVGSKVLGSNGRATEVRGVFPQGVKPSYKVTFSDHSSVEAGPEHLWTVNYRKGGRIWASLTLTTDQLRTRPKLGKLDLSKTTLYLPMLSSPAEFDTKGVLPIEPYTLGCMIANGYLCGTSVVVTVGYDDRPFYQKALCGTWSDTGSAARVLLTGIDKVRDLGLDVLSADKFIPASYMRAHPNDRAALLNGLMDSDGSISKTNNRLTYSTVSYKLAEDIQELIEGLGGIASINTYERHKEGKTTEYRVRMRLPHWVRPFLLPRKAERYKPGRLARPCRTVASVEYVGDVESVCISVAAKDQLYVTEHCIVTHNTIQGIGFVNGLKDPRRVLIVCPPSLRMNWAREFEKWAVLQWEITVIHKPKDFLRFTDRELNDPHTRRAFIISYNRIGGKRNAEINAKLRSVTYDALIGDEIHLCKNPKSQRSQGLFGKRVRGELTEPGLVQSAKRVVLLTGTAIANRPLELFPLLEVVDPDGLGSNFMRFAKRYCGAVRGSFGWDFSGATNLTELQERLRHVCFVRRLKTDVLKELPPKRRQVVTLDPDGNEKILKRQATAYSRHEDALQALEEAMEMAEILDDAEGLEEASRRLSEARRVAFKDMAKERKAVAMAKVPAVLDHVTNLLESTTSSVILFAHHKDVVKALREHTGTDLVITGETPAQDRQAIVDRFQAGEHRVFIGNIAAAGVGLTLTKADTVVFAELDWVPANMLQAEDRCIAKGQLVCCLPMGITKIENVEVGDKVLTHEGNERLVLAKRRREHRGLFTNIKYKRWSDALRCTHDHRVYVLRRGEETPGWVEAHTVLPGDYMCMPRPKDGTELRTIGFSNEWRAEDYYIDGSSPTCTYEGCTEPTVARNLCSVHYRRFLRETKGARPPKPPQRNPRYVEMPHTIEVDDELIYLFGWYIAEGFASISPTKGRFISLSGHTKERPILEKLGERLKQFGVTYTIYKQRNKQALELRAYSVELANWFMAWFGHRAKNKSIPAPLMKLSRRQSLILLRAYVDGDGHRRNNGNQVEWVSASETLSYQMCLLAAKCGYSPHRRRVQHPGRNPHYIGGYTEDMSNAATHLQKSDGAFVYEPVSSVSTEFGNENVYDLTVADDHSFVVGFAAVHNCHRISQTNSVLCQYLVFDGSVDARMLQILHRKMAVIEKALDSTEGRSMDRAYLATKEETESNEKRRAQRTSRWPVATPEQREAAAYAMQSLASRCDGARKKDGQGFNALDTRFGKQLAARATQRPLTDGEVAAAGKLARKYQRQLDVSAIACLWGGAETAA